jgi:hypothetical protein
VAHSKAELKSSGSNVSPCFRLFWTEKLSYKQLLI